MWNSNLPYLFILLAMAGFATLWWDQARCRVLANTIAQHVCRQKNVQFLDGTVVFQKLWPKRNDEDEIRMQRYYAFDYMPEVSETLEDSRKTGFIVMHGTKLVAVGLAPENVQ